MNNIKIYKISKYFYKIIYLKYLIIIHSFFFCFCIIISYLIIELQTVFIKLNHSSFSASETPLKKNSVSESGYLINIENYYFSGISMGFFMTNAFDKGMNKTGSKSSLSLNTIIPTEHSIINYFFHFLEKNLCVYTASTPDLYDD